MEPFTWSQDIFNRWIVKFGPEKQARMRQALLNLHDVTLSKLSMKDLMVKSEVLLKRNDPSWAPRIIYIGSDEYNVLTGPLLDEFNKRLCEALNQFTCPEVEFCFAYGKHDTEIASFLEGCPLEDNYLEGDFSSNDKTQVQDVREIFGHWLKCSGAPDWFVALYLKLAAKFFVRSREYGLFAEINNQLGTGATDTTGRNTTWNMGLWYSFAKMERLVATRCAVLGDDIKINTGQQLVDPIKWQAHCANGKMTLKAKHVEFYCDATFLSRFAVPSNSGPCYVPLIAKALARFNARSNRNSSISDEKYMAGKCLSYAYEFRHIPFMVSFFMRRFASLHVPVEDLTLTDLSWNSRQVIACVPDLVKAVLEEQVILSDDQFLEVIMAKYDLGLYDMENLCSRIILSDTAMLLSDERYYLMAHEVT
jgi:hypothetical protein